MMPYLEPYDLGQEARECGETVHDNPFHYDSDDYDLWYQGFMGAEN